MIIINIRWQALFPVKYIAGQHEDVTTARWQSPVLPWVDYVVALYRVHSQSSEVALYNPSSVGGSYFQFILRDITALFWTPDLQLKPESFDPLKK